MTTVLIIDDQTVSQLILQEVVRTIDSDSDIRIQCFSDPIKALSWSSENTVDLVLTDFMMPQMDGIEFTGNFRQIPNCMDTPIIMVTCIEDKSVRYRALESGATDFLTKPIDQHECRARCINLLKLREQQLIIKDRAKWLENEVAKKTKEITHREKETLLRLAKAGEFRDEETGNHVIRMAEFSYLIASKLELDSKFCEVIRQAAAMHDIGKIGVPDTVLLKPGKLNSVESNIMRKHSQIGYDILKNSTSEYIRTGSIIALNHHERYDGNGYPQGLAGEAIPIEARAAAVADVFDALQSARPYKSAWPMERTLEYLRFQRGKHFDPNCIDAFLFQLDKVVAIQKQLPDKTFSSH